MGVIRRRRSGARGVGRAASVRFGATAAATQGEAGEDVGDEGGDERDGTERERRLFGGIVVGLHARDLGLERRDGGFELSDVGGEKLTMVVGVVGTTLTERLQTVGHGARDRDFIGIFTGGMFKRPRVRQIAERGLRLGRKSAVERVEQEVVDDALDFGFEHELGESAHQTTSLCVSVALTNVHVREGANRPHLVASLVEEVHAGPVTGVIGGRRATNLRESILQRGRDDGGDIGGHETTRIAGLGHDPLSIDILQRHLSQVVLVPVAGVDVTDGVFVRADLLAHFIGPRDAVLAGDQMTIVRRERGGVDSQGGEIGGAPLLHVALDALRRGGAIRTVHNLDRLRGQSQTTVSLDRGVVPRRDFTAEDLRYGTGRELNVPGLDARQVDEDGHRSDLEWNLQERLRRVRRKTEIGAREIRITASTTTSGVIGPISLTGTGTDGAIRQAHRRPRALLELVHRPPKQLGRVRRSGSTNVERTHLVLRRLRRLDRGHRRRHRRQRRDRQRE